MKAAYITQPGPPHSIQWGELDDPIPGATGILIRIGAVSINPIDTYIRSGMISMAIPSPFIVGCDFAGTVEAIGSEVTRFQIGDRVWGSNQGLLGRQGTFAERIVVDESFAYPTPPPQTDESLAALALVSITAHLGLVGRAKLQENETLFVNGGAGGVGSAVIQMGKAMGAKVIASAGSEDRAELCRRFGADLAFNYNTRNLSEVLESSGGGGIDVYWETSRVPDFQGAIGALAENGRMVVMAGRDAQPTFPVGPFYVKGCRLVGFAMFKASAPTQHASAKQINQWLQAGALRPHIGHRFPLSQSAEAHQLQEDNTLNGAGTLCGKIVLQPE